MVISAPHGGKIDKINVTEGVCPKSSFSILTERIPSTVKI